MIVVQTPCGSWKCFNVYFWVFSILLLLDKHAQLRRYHWRSEEAHRCTDRNTTRQDRTEEMVRYFTGIFCFVFFSFNCLLLSSKCWSVSAGIPYSRTTCLSVTVSFNQTFMLLSVSHSALILCQLLGVHRGLITFHFIILNPIPFALMVKCHFCWLQPPQEPQKGGYIYLWNPVL